MKASINLAAGRLAMRHLTISITFATTLLAPFISVQAAITEFEQPNAYAVVIGISQYREEVIPKVAYGVKDAEAMAALLETQGGIPKTHIRLLTDSKATGNDLRSVGDWLSMRVKPDSTVYVYYAGHGTPNPKTGGAYLVPWDGHPDYPSGLYPLNDLYSTLNKLPAKDIIVLLDSCFSGAQGRSVLAKGARPMVVSVENPLLAGGKIVVLAAATGNQISSDYDKAGHGLFTFHVLNGLRGGADTNKDGIVTLQELYNHVQDRVAFTALEELNREQTPVILPDAALSGRYSTISISKAFGGLGLENYKKRGKKKEGGHWIASHGLIGPVRTVTIEKGFLFYKDDQWWEQPKQLEEIINFNDKGKTISSLRFRRSGHKNPMTGEFMEFVSEDKTVDVFDEMGNNSESIFYKDGVSYAKSVMTHDPHGNTLTSAYYSEGALKDRHIYRYDDQGNLIEIISYDAGRLKTRDVHTLNSDGQRVSVVTYNSSGDPVTYSKMAYDESGNETEDIYTKADGGLIQRTANNYDAKGNLTERTVFSAETVETTSYSYKYLEFDSHGNWTKRVEVFTAESPSEKKTGKWKEYRTISYY